MNIEDMRLIVVDTCRECGCLVEQSYDLCWDLTGLIDGAGI